MYVLAFEYANPFGRDETGIAGGQERGDAATGFDVTKISGHPASVKAAASSRTPNSLVGNQEIARLSSNKLENSKLTNHRNLVH